MTDHAHIIAQVNAMTVAAVSGYKANAKTNDQPASGMDPMVQVPNSRC